MSNEAKAVLAVLSTVSMFCYVIGTVLLDATR
jgi:hypothetical protein